MCQGGEASVTDGLCVSFLEGDNLLWFSRGRSCCGGDNSAFIAEIHTCICPAGLFAVGEPRMMLVMDYFELVVVRMRMWLLSLLENLI